MAFVAALNIQCMNVSNIQIFPLFFLGLPLLTTAKALSKFVRDAPKREAEMAPDARSGERAGLVKTVEQVLGIEQKSSGK